MKRIAKDVESRNLIISHFTSSWIGIAIFENFDRQAFAGGRMRDQLKHDFQGGQGFGTPVDGNEGEEAMLDKIPFTGGWWIMGNGNGKLFFIRQFLQLLLP